MVVVGGLMVGVFSVSVPDTYNLFYSLPFANALALACCLREMALLSSIGHMCAHITTANIFIIVSKCPLQSTLRSHRGDWDWVAVEQALLMVVGLFQIVPSLFAETCPYVLYIYIIYDIYLCHMHILLPCDDVDMQIVFDSAILALERGSVSLGSLFCLRVRSSQSMSLPRCRSASAQFLCHSGLAGTCPHMPFFIRFKSPDTKDSS